MLAAMSKRCQVGWSCVSEEDDREGWDMAMVKMNS